MSSGHLISLTQNLVRGDASINNCTGTLIKPKLIHFNYTISVSATGTYNTVRVLVFRWKDAALPVPSGILAVTGSAYAPLSELYWVNHRKIKILYDKMHELYDRGGGVSAVTAKATINPGGSSIQLPATGSGTQPQMDGIYMLAISDDSLTPNPVVDYFARVMFTDA